MSFVQGAPSLEQAHETLWQLLAGDLPPEALQVPADSTLLATFYGYLDVETTDRKRALSATWVDLPPKEAIEFFRSKRIISPERFRELDASAKREAFSISGLHRRYGLERAHEHLADAIEQGTPQRKVLGSLREAMAAGGLTDAHPWHVETVFRTNVIGAYHEGRWRQMQAVKRSRPYWRYRTVGDGRVRPAHREMNGHVARADDPIWNSWTPPCGFNCRCTLETLSQSDLEAEGLSPDRKPPDVQPDIGWAGSPALNETRRKAQGRLRREVNRMRVLQPPTPATSGKAAYSSAGDLGWSTAKRRADVVDALAGIDAQQAVALAERGPVNIVSGKEPALRSGAARFTLTMPTQHVDGLEQLVSRIAADPRTTSLVEQLRYRPVARLIPGQAPRRFSAAVVRDGITRASAVQMQVDVSDLAQVQALAELLLGAEQGSGHAVRFAAEAADLTIAGPRTAPAPFRLAYRSTERVGDKTHVRVSRTKLADQDQVAVFITQRRYDGLP